jgi:3-oxoacyl-[acyl-carrier-protein] synthase II
MKVYIRSAGNISPQHSLDTDSFFLSRITTTNNYFKSEEPDYDSFIDSKMIRRMSRVVKMGVTAAMTCLKNAHVEIPSAILTATAYGCLEDSSSFLRRMIEFDEKLLSPTAFIQSTHNTVGAQIALLLKCHNYNNTIVHRALSFENALTESMLLLEEGTGQVLVGAVDEITDDSHAIISRFGLYRKTDNHAGNIAGEGAAFFLLDKDPGKGYLAILKGLRILYNPENIQEIQDSVMEFLKENETTMDQIGLILTSHTGNKKHDEQDRELKNSLFNGKVTFPFKLLCGDYPSASGFALWMAAIMLKEQMAPFWMEHGPQFPLENILIHHHSGNSHHSFFLISAN